MPERELKVRRRETKSMCNQGTVRTDTGLNLSKRIRERGLRGGVFAAAAAMCHVVCAALAVETWSVPAHSLWPAATRLFGLGVGVRGGGVGR
eukprot:scaffold2930_cov105-Isochrysis_galbana.AAC.4